jgi:hypothetical protein
MYKINSVESYLDYFETGGLSDDSLLREQQRVSCESKIMGKTFKPANETSKS